jgi:hypothetical protein
MASVEGASKTRLEGIGYQRIEEGRGRHLMGEMKRMQCGARGSGSVAGEAGATLGGGTRLTAAALPYFGTEGGRSSQVGRVGQKAELADGADGPSWAEN